MGWFRWVILPLLSGVVTLDSRWGRATAGPSEHLLPACWVSFHLRPLFFDSCCSHKCVCVFGVTLAHEFYISCGHAEWNLLSAFAFGGGVVGSVNRVLLTLNFKLFYFACVSFIFWFCFIFN